jgi:solute carrier family 25 (mitochondrial phosphate transporter), member 3
MPVKCTSFLIHCLCIIHICLCFVDSYSCEYGSNHYYALCGLGGIVSCGLTHTAIVPLDLVKCRIQVDPAKYGNLIKGFKVTLKDAGVRELGKGWAPTFFGYSAQGLFKFGFYEIFKHVYADMVGEVRSLINLCK